MTGLALYTAFMLIVLPKHWHSAVAWYMVASTLIAEALPGILKFYYGY